MTSAFTRHGQNFLFVKRGRQTFYSLWAASTTNRPCRWIRHFLFRWVDASQAW